MINFKPLQKMCLDQGNKKYQDNDAKISLFYYFRFSIHL